MKILLVSTLGLLTLLACLPGGAAQGGGASSVPKPSHDTLDQAGIMSRIHTARQVVVRDEKAFDALWKEHAAGQESMPAPKVDFKKYDVIGIFAGMKPTGGYSITVGAIKRKGKTAVVEATLFKPGPGAITTQIVTYPFALRAVPKLPPTVKFSITEKAR